MISERLQDNVALITGAASGVGRATAHRFATERCRAIYLFDRNAEGLDQVAAELGDICPRAVRVVGDVGVDEDCERVVQQVVAEEGRIDIFVGNAPAHSAAPFLEMSRDEWDRVLRINLRASFVLGQLVARVMREQGAGSIMYTSSVSSLGASMEYAHYGASKAGIANLVQTMALELVGYGVRVNAVSPGPLDTPQSRDVLGSDEAMERARESWPLVPMNRLGLPEEVAAAFAFLASPDASYITGINLVVDGGLTAHAYSIPEELTER
ncbi:MAG TPA: SDR family NAD(P)-dependent oxidoreductase [Nocardioides sp.]|nr:SDR family NAD(P)-dependent oxidoreductase [Nocardioides sp.]